MGTVYRALDPTIGRTVAIKAIRLTDFTDPLERERVRERLLQEARVAGLLSHPSITTVFDVLEEEDSAFIVMEYVQGSSLQELIRVRQLPERTQLLSYLEQVADALDYAHRKGVIHRDIKLENILISSEAGLPSLAKISDFGISKFISQNTTHSGTMIGTPSYMSPEQIQGLPLDGRSDQYSFAVAVYELLTGRKPFDAERLATLFYQICKQDPPKPEDLNNSLTPQVGEVLARALAKEPDNRFSSCGEFITGLTEALSLSGEWRLPNTAGQDVAALASAAAAVGSAPLNRGAAAPSVLEDETPVEIPPTAMTLVPVSEPEPHLETVLAPLPRRPRSELGDLEDGPRPSGWRNRIFIVLALLGVVAGLFFLTGKGARQEGSDAEVRSTENAKIEATPPKTTEQKGSDLATHKAKEKTPSREQTSIPSEGSAAPRSSPLVEFSVTTEPRGVQVVFDDRPEYSCQAPCTFNLPSGRHTLTAELKGFDTARRIFNLPDDRALIVNLSQSMGVLLVTTEPSGSTILVDGKEYGTTPLTLRLPIGTHQLVVVNGRGRHEEAVVIQNDQFTSRSFRWQ